MLKNSTAKQEDVESSSVLKTSTQKMDVLVGEEII